MISQTNALDEIAADLDSEDDFDGESEWCDEDRNLNLHGGDVGCARYRKVSSDEVVAGPSGI